MATINLFITVPDENQDEIVEFFVKNQGYVDQILSGETMVNNPESRLDAFCRLMSQFIKEHYRSYKSTADMNRARKDASSYVDRILITTKQGG